MKRLNLLTVIAFLICNCFSTNAQSKVVILDSLQAKKIIVELAKYDLAKQELKIFAKLDSLSLQRIKLLKDAQNSLQLAFNEKELETDKYKKAFKRESRKKNIWKIACVAFVALILVK